MDPGKTFNDCNYIGLCPITSFIIGQLTNDEMQFHNTFVAKKVIGPPVYLIPGRNNI